MATLWIDTLHNLNVVANGSASDALTAELTVGELRVAQMTLLRTILRLDLAATVRDSGEGDQVVDLGIGVIAREAAGNFPDPNITTDHPALGWVWRSRYRIYASAVDDQNVDIVRIDLDLRSRRKLHNGMSFLSINNTDNQGTSTAVTLTGLIRQLWLLS